MSRIPKDNLTLHSNLIDLLGKGDMYTIEGIISELNDTYHMSCEVDRIEKIVKEYVKEGILIKHRDEGAYYYYVSYNDAKELGVEVDGLVDAISFYSDTALFNEIGKCIAKQMKIDEECMFIYPNNLGNKWDSQLNNGTLINTKLTQSMLNIIDAIKKERQIEIVSNNEKQKKIVTPVKIYVSSISNMKWIVGEDYSDNVIKAFNLNEYHYSKTLKNVAEYTEIAARFSEIDKYSWGINGINNPNGKISKLRVILNIEEYYEQRVIDRINREKRQAEFERIGNNTYALTMELSNCKEALNWIRTFTGRIVMIECEDKSIVRSVYNDIENMYKMYN